MLCEKCGNNNSDSVTVCKHCGALMPQKASCGGFSDILSYEAKRNAEQNAASFAETNQSYAADDVTRRIQVLEQELNVKMRVYKKKIKSASLMAGIALAVGAIAFVMSFVYNPHTAEIKTLKKEIALLKQQPVEMKIDEAEMPEGNLMQDMNDFYSVSSEQVKKSEEAWKKATETPVPNVPEQPAVTNDVTSEPVAEQMPADVPVQQDAQ